MAEIPKIDYRALDMRTRNQIAKDATKVLLSGQINGRNLGLNDKRRLTSLIKFMKDPNARAGAIAKVVSAIGSAGGALAVNIGEILTSTILPREETKRQEASLAAQTQQAAIAANKEIQKEAIAAGVWNAGLAGNPSNNANQQAGSDGQSKNGTTGSFLGG